MKSLQKNSIDVNNRKVIKVKAKKMFSVTNTVSKEQYSGKELAEFRVTIENRLSQAKMNHELLKNSLGYIIHNTSYISNPSKVMEEPMDMETKVTFERMVTRQEKLIEDLKNALIRIENKTYGICTITGKLIPKNRLNCIPQAMFCIEQN